MRLRDSVMYAVIMVLCAACSASKPLNTTFVAQRWGETMGAYDVTGVFPPRGGINVGDVYVVADIADPKDAGKYGRRAILLGRTDLRDQMQREMKTSLNLPPTAASDPVQSIFTSQPTVVDLAPAGFGGLNIATVTDTDLGVSFPVKVFRAVFGASGHSQVVLSVSLPRATHAEVGSLEAYDSLVNFCTHSKDGITPLPNGQKSRCSYDDDGFLTSAWSLANATDDPAKIRPKILLITHVYYASEIDYSYSDQTGVAVGADVSLTAASAAQTASSPASSTQGNATPPAAAPASGSDAAAAAATAASNVATQTSTRAEAAIKTLGIAGGTLKVVHADLNGADIKQVFPKPVAIGIRGLYITP